MTDMQILRTDCWIQLPDGTITTAADILKYWRDDIAPMDGLELTADIEGIGCCTVIVRNRRVHIAAETVRDIISMGTGKIAPPDGSVLFDAITAAPKVST